LGYRPLGVLVQLGGGFHGQVSVLQSGSSSAFPVKFQLRHSRPRDKLVSTVIWRSAIVAGYIAFAIVIGVAYGGRGLAILSFFYFWAGAWVVFLLMWSWAARAVGRWNFHRLDSAPVTSRADRLKRSN
jgi:hypothetical protein